MPNCIDRLPRKSFNTYGIVLLTLFGFFGVTVISIATAFQFTTTFQCNLDKTISNSVSTSKFINTKCSLKYEEKFLFIAPISAMFTFNFGVVFLLSIIYGYLVKNRVEKFDCPTGTATDDDHENQPMMPLPYTSNNPRESRECLAHFSTYSLYIIYLIVSRIILMLVFALWIFYPANIPNHYSCPLPQMQSKSETRFNKTLNRRSNFTFVDCTNPSGAKSNILANVVATIDIILAILAILELCYIAWLTINDRSFSTDQEFSTVYLLRKRKRIRKVVNKLREKMDSDDQKIFELKDDFGDDEISLRKLDEIYVNVVIQEGREQKNAYPKEFIRHRIYEAHLETPSSVTRIQSTADIFKPTNEPGQNQKYPQTILVIGRPGIGKTTLTKKLLHQWKEKEDEFWSEKIVILLQFRTITNKSVTLREMLSYGDGLSFDDREAVYSSILSNPSKAILIFDGLDELTVDSESFVSNTESCRSPNENMSVYSIFKMLVTGAWLKGATVLTTSRPTAQHLFQDLNFERTVEILGFFEEQIKEYVFKFCHNSDNRISEMIWNEIKESAELHSSCYIPVNSYIVCLTLKESIDLDETWNEFGENLRKNTPNNITELYKRAIKVLLYRHHPKYKKKQRPNDYLIAPLPKDLEDELVKLKEVAKNGVSEGKLIFERRTGDEFGDLANCGLFHKLPDKRRNFFCFLHLTLQEFLAAAHVVDDFENVDEFLKEHVDDPRWHLVIQFVAGLVGDKIREAKETVGNDPKESENRKIIIDKIKKRLEDWTGFLRTENRNNIGLLGIKCLHEMQDVDITRSISSDFKDGEDGILCLKQLSIAPVDATALFEFLRNMKSLKRLEFVRGQVRGDYSYQKMAKFLLNNTKVANETLSSDENFGEKAQKYQSDAMRSNYCQLTELQLKNVGFGDQGVKCLSVALKSENCELTALDVRDNVIEVKGVKCLSDALETKNCKLTSLILRRNYINDEGTKCLSEALKSENCKLTLLDLSRIGMNDEGANCLGNALKTENCKLTSLNLSHNNIEEEGARCLSDALKSENCKIASLDLSDNEINDEGAKCLSDALNSENCKLTSLNLSHSNIKDEGAKCLSDALKSENCKVTALNLNDNVISDEGAKCFCNALQSNNCKLSSLGLRCWGINDEVAKCLSDVLKSKNCKLTSLGLNYDICDEGAKYLGDALKSENCKLTALNLDNNEISDEGVKALSDALKSKNCKLTALNLRDNGIQNEDVKCLSDALKSKNCKLSSLVLCANALSDEDAKCLSDALRSENSKLTTLDLSDNKISDEGAKCLSDALKSENSKLTTLDLSGNKINDEGAKCFSDALKSENCKLTALDLTHNEINDKGAKCLKDVLKCKNCKLNELFIGKYNNGSDPRRNLCELKEMEV